MDRKCMNFLLNLINCLDEMLCGVKPLDNFLCHSQTVKTLEFLRIISELIILLFYPVNTPPISSTHSR